MKKAYPVDTLWTRWVEVKLWDGRVMKGPKKPTAVLAGKLPAPLKLEVAQEWKDHYERMGQPVQSVCFRYRKRG
jgi:hypothetical protein